MCGQKSSRILLVSLLLSVASLPIYSDDVPEWAANMTETEAKQALVESVTRLETTTNELEQSLNLNQAWKTWSVRQSELLDNAMSLNRELLTARKEDAERFEIIETSFNDYEKESRRAMIRNTSIGFGIGALTGALIMAVLQ